MVDPFQVLDNGNNSSTATYTKQNEILIIKRNMNETTVKDEIVDSNLILNNKVQDSNDVDVSRQPLSAGEKDVQQNIVDKQEKIIMGGPSNHEASDIIVIPSSSGRLSNESNLKQSIASSETVRPHNTREFHNSVENNLERSHDPGPSKHSLVNNCINHKNGTPLTSNPQIKTNLSKQLLENTDASDNITSSGLLCNNGELRRVSSANSVFDDNHFTSAIESLSDNVMEDDSNHHNSSPTSTTTNDLPEMDNRRVEPLKINIHREPIKTIIKIPKTVHENSVEPTIPKITIKQILKPQNEDVAASGGAVDAASSSASTSYSFQNSISNLEPTETHIVPKLTIRNSTNASCSVGQSEIVPKLTIKMENHVTMNSKEKPLILEDGVKVTIKPIPEPPIPKLTLRTSSNDCAEVITTSVATGTSTTPKYTINSPNSPGLNRVTTKPKQPESSNVPKIKIKPILKPSDEVTSNSEQPIPKLTILRSDENVSSCSSSSSTDNIKTVPKLFVRVPKELDADASASQSGPDHLNHDDQIVEIPKLVINKKDANEPEPTTVPKLTIRQVKSSELGPVENIVIPKVTIKPIVNPDNMCEQDQETLISPKITIKPIPKPIDITQPLEVVVTSPPLKSIADLTDSQQHSPRIILKINKTLKEAATDQLNEELVSTIVHVPSSLPNNEQNAHISSSSSGSSNENELKRTNASVTSSGIQAKKPKKDENVEHVPTEPRRVSNDMEIINLDSDEDENEKLDMKRISPQISPSPRSMSPVLVNCEESKLKEMLTKMHQTIKDNARQVDLVDDDDDDVIIVERTDTAISLPAAESIAPTEQIPAHVPPPSKPPTFSEFQTTLFRHNNIVQAPLPPPVSHPLLQRNIERANLLEIMMNANNDKHNNLSPKHKENNIGQVVTTPPPSTAPPSTVADINMLFMSEGSSSDCIMLEDNGSQGFSTDFSNKVENGRGDKLKDQCIDRDSGVDVSNSVKSLTEDAIDEDIVTPMKRGRGRPKKQTPAVEVKTRKIEEQNMTRRKFAGLIAENNAKTAEISLLATEIPKTPIITTSPTTTTTSKANTTTTKTTTTSTARQEATEIVPIKLTAVATTTNTITSTETITPTITTATTTTTASATTTTTTSSSSTPPPPTLLPSINNEDLQSPKLESKDRKRRIRIDDDDESPTFNPMARGTKRGRGRGGRGNRGARGGLKHTPRSGSSMGLLSTPEKSRDAAVFTTPEGKDRRKQVFTTLQLFEEDTLMGVESISTPIRSSEYLNNEESQSSLFSSTSVTADGITMASSGGGGSVSGSGTATTSKKRGKIEVIDQDGITDFTVDMIAEYDWPRPKGCCPAKNRETFMIQEQVAEFLDVKSFKRKYPDLPRRMVEMEERNYLMEKGMVSEKMCDLGLTAVLASDILDIMHNDFYEKYEDYKKYLREKHIRDISLRQKAQQAEAVEKNLSVRDNAIRAASSWNISFNKERKEDRRQCLDLQNFVIQIPEGVRNKMNRPTPAPSNYPVALVPGQFQEYYREYSAAELLCYPINSALANPIELDKKLRDFSNRNYSSDSDSSDSSDSDNDSSDDSDSETSDSSDDDRPTIGDKCRVCDKPQNINRDNKPELFVVCSSCRRRAHPSCIEMPPRMSLRVQEYSWQCSECKNCTKCRQITNEDKMLFCDQCDRGYHIYCLGIATIPAGRWHCSICSICTVCGTRNPEGHNNPNLTKPQRKKLVSTAKWTHEYRINHVSNLREHSAMLCTPCTRLKSESTTAAVVTTAQSSSST